MGQYCDQFIYLFIYLFADTALRIRKSLNLKFILKIATQEILDFLECDRLSIVRLTRRLSQDCRKPRDSRRFISARH